MTKIKEPIVVLLPEGISDVGEIFESNEFKEFISKLGDKPTRPTSVFSAVQVVSSTMLTGKGQGKSYLEEYLKTLPKITFDEIYEGKANGRTICALNIGR